MFIGIDYGTSSVKALLVDIDQRIVATASVRQDVSLPAPGHSEQRPADWWDATHQAMRSLRDAAPAAMARVEGIGLSGQMHGAVVLDQAQNVLRPGILWNDVRSMAECAELEAAQPGLRQITGNQAMPGFTAPKLLWLQKHEPELFEKIAHVLLPKAWVRLQMTGEMIEDMSDAAGTLWLDVGARKWSAAMLAACGLTESNMPRLVEGSDAAGRLKPELAAEWGIGTPPVVAGSAGDNAAGAIGLGAIEPGDAFVSLGTSGVLWATTDQFRPNADAATHAFCHALPNLWHQMGVTLSAAASFGWWAKITGQSEAALLAELPPLTAPSPVTFLPYLSGERTPLNSDSVRGEFANLSHATDRAAMTQAVLEGVAYSMRDCLASLEQAGTSIQDADVIGGGSRSEIWIRIIASVLNVRMHKLAEGEHGGAFGAARLARLAARGENPQIICTKPHRETAIAPVPALVDAYAAGYRRYRDLSAHAAASTRR